MPRLTHHDKQQRDVAKIASSVGRIKDLIVACRDKHYTILTVRDDADLFEAQEAVQRILDRLNLKD